jgi:hypothetical protein
MTQVAGSQPYERATQRGRDQLDSPRAAQIHQSSDGERELSFTQEKECGLTTWRSAASAPHESQNAITILGAFVSCNGVLAGAVTEAHLR